ncbi:MAG: M1 family aminopeptidase [bacterium]|jgi:aminopeptidase N
MCSHSSVKVNESLVGYVDLYNEIINMVIPLNSKVSTILSKCLLLGLLFLIQVIARAQTAIPFKEIAEIERKSLLLGQQALQSTTQSSKASTNFDVHYLNCTWLVDPGIRYIRGKVKAGFTITERTNIITFDLADELKIDSILFRSKKITHYRPIDNSAIINLGIFLEPNTKEEVEIFYKGVPPSVNRNGSFQNAIHAGVPVLWTLSQPYGSKDWWPCKDGLDDKIDSVDISITTPEAYTSSSIGIYDGESITNGFRTTRWKHRYPVATYLIAFAATNYTVIKDQVVLGNTILPLIDYAYPESENEFLNATGFTKRTLKLLHDIFVPYPFIKEKYGHTQFSGNGGMEHQTNSFMQNMNEALIIHEAAHQWFGNMVTCGSWKDLWLNEGFAVFCTNLVAEKNYPKKDVLNLYRNQINYIASRPNGSVYVTDTSNFQRLFDARLTYNKAGWILQMLKWELGDSVFFRACRNYLKEKAFGFASTKDLITHFEKESNRDLEEFFSDWLYGEGFPSYSLEWATAGRKWVQTKLSQVTSDPSVKFFEMSVPIQFKNRYFDTTIVIRHMMNDQVNFTQLGFIPDTAIIDPEFKIISADNRVSKTEIITSNDITIFPNPIGNEFTILLKNMSEGILFIRIYDTKGDVLYQRRIGNFKGNDLVRIPSEKLPGGMYWIAIKKDEDPTIVRKVLK